jgi:osmotically inducible protein OsmC
MSGFRQDSVQSRAYGLGPRLVTPPKVPVWIVPPGAIAGRPRPDLSYISRDSYTRRTTMPKRRAQARWEGSLQDGRGTMRMQTGSYEGPYSFQSRFEEGDGTNPEELIGAAHAGCFSMALSGELGRAGHEPESVETTATVHLDKVEAGFKITHIELDTKASVPGIDDAEFQRLAQTAKEGCPVSQALAGVEIGLNAELA